MSLGGGADTVLIRTAVDPSGATAGLEKVARSAKTTGDAVEKDLSTRSTSALGKFGGALDGIGKKVGGLASKLTSQPVSNGILQGAGLAGGVLAITAVGTAIQSVVSFLGDAAAKFEEQQRLTAQSAQAIKSTGAAAHVSAGQVEELAGAIQQKTGIDDAAIQKGANLLLTFTNIRNEAGKGNDIFNQTVGIMTDMGVAMGTDASGAAIQLGKALNDPVKGITALTRVGVTFTKEQKDAIAAMVKQGDTLGAQKVILAELNKEFGGSAEAFGKTAEGIAAKAQNRWDDVQKKIGAGVEVFKQAAVTAFGVVVDAVSGLIDGIGNLGTAFDNLHRFIDSSYVASQDQSNALRDLADRYGLNYDSIVQFTTAQKAATAAQADAIKTGHEQDLLNTLLDEQQKNQQPNLDALATAYAVYGISMADVVRLNNEALNGTTKVTTAQEENEKATNAARAQLIEYAKATGIANILTYASASATGQQTKAEDEYAAALRKRHDEMTAGDKVDLNQLGTLKRQQEALRASRLAFGQWGEVVGGATTAVAHDLRNFRSEARGAAINVVRSFEGMQGGVIAALKDTTTGAKKQVNQLWYDIKHPGELETNREALAKQMRRAHRAMLAAEKTGDAALVAEAEAVVADLQAQWDRLNGTVTIQTRVNQTPFTGEGTGTGRGSGQGSNARASGGPIWPGDWIVGERGPERMRITPSGMGYVWPTPSNQRVGAAQVHRVEFGTLNVNVNGPVSPETGRRIGREIAGSLVSGLQMRLGVNG